MVCFGRNLMVQSDVLGENGRPMRRFTFNLNIFAVVFAFLYTSHGRRCLEKQINIQDSEKQF